ncbi:FecCD family ABC transporter permease [Shimia marina]|uniref:Hemin transport system permease protein HmuU n=1 Tax=Shimia marina TaxID=321267 RepID=A0A0P1FDT9_9RHOB|nr:iron ABC transporter permease [Shimia marina]CUH52090.1 Hemin transport system permease protein HmuU [Shimia marina]SFE63687.1 iron complex transport system permease protein [Shimia marina]
MTIDIYVSEMRRSYASQTARRYGMIFVVAAILLLSFLVDIATGPGNYSLSTVWQVLTDPLSNGVRLKVIVWDYRLPVAITAVIVGALLAVAGAQMQTILNNPLAEPFTLGVSAAASFGASLAIVLGFSIIPAVGPLLVSINAFVFALLTCGFILLATRLKGVGSETMILFGIAIFFTFSALLALMQYMASEDQIARIVFWMMGSLGRASWEKISIGVLLLGLAIPFSLLRTWPMTALRMGEATAESMGVDVARLRVEMLICVSLLAATAVSFVGTVGFVGLVGPHIARLIVGEDQRFFVPLSALVGAVVLSLTSVISKSITPGIIYPIGIITSLIGVPVFISIILGTRREKLS